MENIYKIRVRTNPDPTGLFPSERRYSASTVLGLGVVHLALAATALLLASLSATVYQNQYNTENLIATIKTKYEITQKEVSTTTINQSMPATTIPPKEYLSFLTPSVETYTETEHETPEENSTVKNVEPAAAVRRKRAKEAANPLEDEGQNERKEFNPCTNLSVAPSLMTIGALAAGLTGLLAWKRWYIDHNIRWFFCMSVVSSVTSSISLIVTAITIFLVNDRKGSSDSFMNVINGKSSPEMGMPNKELVLAYNIAIASFLEVMWSVLSTKIAYVGMRADYPEDIINRSRGKVQVNTIHKGNKRIKIVPPDIINHFPPVPGKIAKYFPRKEVPGNLPKAESTSEYMDRVKKFLSSNPENNK